MARVPAAPAQVRLRRRRDGSEVWCAQVYMGTNRITGKPNRPYREFPEARSREEAERMATRWRDARLRPLLCDQLMDYIEKAVKAGQIRDQTAARYESHVRRHVWPYLGGAAVDSVTARELGDLYVRLLDDGLSRPTVRGLHWFLSGAFSRFVKDGVVAADPTQDAWHPTDMGGQAIALGVEDARALMAALREAAFAGGGGRPTMEQCAAMAAIVALRTGVRVGEACAIRPCDLSGRDLHVSGTVVELPRRGARRQSRAKTKAGDRHVALGGPAAEDVARWVALAGTHGATGPLISMGGGWLRPSSVSRAFGRIARRAGMPEGTTFHTLRHTHASILLAGGTNVREVSERLGHSDASTTLRLYAHVLPGRDQAVADAFDGALR